jgi:hypothetical protein
MTMIEQKPIERRKASKERRKEITARYYQRHRNIIKLAMMLDIPMKEARATYQNSVTTTSPGCR